MKTEHKTLNDLDYLSQQGFANVKHQPEDTDLLKKRVRMRIQTASGSSYFYLISLLMGVFLGLSLFFAIDTPRSEKIAVVKENELELPAAKYIQREPLVLLDTVRIEKENFVKEKSNPKRIIKSEPIADQKSDSIEEILPKQIDLNALSRSEMEQKKIRFIINSPVYYLHDMKISNYMLLYFKKNSYVPLNGLMADNTAYRENNQNQNHLKESAVFYLHEEIARAMLLFKKGKYDACLIKLNEIAAYNNEDINCDFYRGMCNFYKKNYSLAIEFLDKCIGNPNNAFLQEGDYYKALSLYEMGELDRAGFIFKQISEDGEFYADKAQYYLKKLTH